MCVSVSASWSVCSSCVSPQVSSTQAVPPLSVAHVNLFLPLSLPRLFFSHLLFFLLQEYFWKKEVRKWVQEQLKACQLCTGALLYQCSYTHWWLRMFQSLFLHQSRANTCVYPMLYLACLRHVLTAQHTRPSKTRRVFNTLLVPHPRHKPDTASASH